LEHTSEKKKTLENIKEAIKNGRSRDTGNIDEKQTEIFLKVALNAITLIPTYENRT
jgi:hypothetical protein